jgi:phenylpyruvate tautomerase PptA (4-oxalocrotonate tautomerase family)
MPLIQVFPSVPVPESRVSSLLASLASILSEQLQKPQRWVMTRLAPPAHMTFAGTNEPTCYAEVKNIGSMSPELTEALSAAITRELSEALDIPTARIYIEFADAQPHLWGYDGATFA